MECGSSLLLLYSQHVPLFATPWTVARQAPLSMGFSKQEYRSGLLLPSPGDGIPDPGIEPTSPAVQANSRSSEPPGKPVITVRLSQRFSLLCSSSPLPGPHPARNLLQAPRASHPLSPARFHGAHTCSRALRFLCFPFAGWKGSGLCVVMKGLRMAHCMFILSLQPARSLKASVSSLLFLPTVLRKGIFCLLVC